MVSEFVSPLSAEIPTTDTSNGYMNKNKNNNNNSIYCSKDSLPPAVESSPPSRKRAAPLYTPAYTICSIPPRDEAVKSPVTRSSTSPVPTMACSYSSEHPNQATPLLVGVKMINEWPMRNGSISGGGGGGVTNGANGGGVLHRGNSDPNANGGHTPIRRSGGKEDDKLEYANLNNGNVVTVDIPYCSDEEYSDFPKERLKTFVALLVLFSSFVFTTISLATVHDRVPDRDRYPPLPDTFLDLVAARGWALTISEIFIMITTNITVFIVLLHKHRYIVFRRMFLILSLLYFMRSITMFVTVLPVSDTNYDCSDKVKNPTIGLILMRALQLFSGLGLTINGKHTYCGDYIYSGHTTILVMGYLMICEYSPRRWYLLHWAAWLMAFVGVIMVLVSHGHYTVDVVIAYYVTTRLFWLYHTLANNAFLKQRSPTNYLAREWWYPFFRYFEGNVKGPVPLEYELPISLPCWSGSYRAGS